MRHKSKPALANRHLARLIHPNMLTKAEYFINLNSINPVSLPMRAETCRFYGAGESNVPIWNRNRSDRLIS